MVVAGLGPASAGLTKPKRKPTAARKRLRRARERLRWFALNANCRLVGASFICRLLRRFCGGATFGFLQNYLNAWKVGRNSGGNRLRLQRLTSQEGGKTLDRFGARLLALEVSGGGDGDPEHSGGPLCDLRGGFTIRRTA